MTNKLSDSADAAAEKLFQLFIVACLLVLAYHHLNLVTHDFPLDYNEPGMLVITSVIAEGGNPFSLENQPARISVYPVLYNILVAPATLLFDNSFATHRVVAGLFLLACCGLVFYLCRRSSGTFTDSLTAAVLLYPALLFYSTPIASPNTLGLFLFLAAIVVPWAHRFSNRSLAVSMVLGILAFFTKQYFLAALGYVALYVFLTESKKRAIYFGLVSLAVLAICLGVVSVTSPYYLDDTYFVLQAGAQATVSNQFVWPQFRDFAGIYYPLFLLLAFMIFLLWRNSDKAESSSGSQLIDIGNFDSGLLVRKPDYIWYCCLCSLVITALVLAKNPGNHLTYLLQLISPFLLAGTVALVARFPRWRWLFRAFALVTLYNSYALLPTDFSVDEKHWQTVRKEIAQADDLYTSTLLLHKVLEQNGPIYLNGHTRYFLFGSYKPSMFVRAEPELQVSQVWERYVKQIEAKIRNQEFDVLLMDNWMRLPVSPDNPDRDLQATLDAYYDKTAEFRLPLMSRPGGGTFKFKVYKPKTETTTTETTTAPED